MIKLKVLIVSLPDLKKEREEIEIFVNRKNRKLAKKNVYIELIVWEDFLNQMPRVEQQNEYTKEEYEVVIKQFHKGFNPQYIFTYFKDIEISTSQITDGIINLLEFKKSLDELGLFYLNFKEIEELTYSIDNQIDKVLSSLKISQQDNDRNSVFISYSHKDKEWIDQLLLFLKPIERQGKIKVWSDKQIEIGSKWKDEIINGLNHAQVGVLLISQSFLASDFIAAVEVPKLIRASEKEGAKIIAIVIEPCTVQLEPDFMEFQFFNSPTKPLSGLSDFERQTSFVKLTKTIHELLNKNKNED